LTTLKYKPQTLKKLKEVLDNKFDYLGNPPNMVGFHLSIKRFLNLESSHLKAWYVGGEDKALLYYDPN